MITRLKTKLSLFILIISCAPDACAWFNSSPRAQIQKAIKNNNLDSFNKLINQNKFSYEDLLEFKRLSSVIVQKQCSKYYGLTRQDKKIAQAYKSSGIYVASGVSIGTYMAASSGFKLAAIGGISIFSVPLIAIVPAALVVTGVVGACVTYAKSCIIKRNNESDYLAACTIYEHLQLMLKK